MQFKITKNQKEWVETNFKFLIQRCGEPRKKGEQVLLNFQYFPKNIILDKNYIGDFTKWNDDFISNYSRINLSVPMRKNQHNFVEFSRTKSKIRKRIETNISQLCGQFTINTNFAKTFQGLATRIVSKITSFTMIQYLNFFVFKRSMNKLKINLC